MKLADNLKQIRKKHNMSQEDLAEALGVSRQSVSKWESGISYPEMDKVLEICKMFNLNIDELLNQNIKEVNNNNQTKNNINKIIDDFLEYITKTVDMFSSMKFKEKTKCLIEQLVVATIILIIFTIIGSICGSIINSVLMMIPYDIRIVIYSILEGIYLALALVLGTTLLLHIFKVRYLDYYIIEKEESNEEEKGQDNQEEKEVSSQPKLQKLILEKKKEKIIIRDPKHSGYKFISSLLKIVLFILKSFIVMTAGIFCITLITLTILIVVSLLFVKTGLTFAGTILILISSLVINVLILIILYNFIVSRKNKKEKLAIAFFTSLIVMGIGAGLICISIPNFTVVTSTEDEVYQENEITVPMEENIFFDDWYGNIKYVESDNTDIKIVYKHTPYYELKMNKVNYENYYCFHLNLMYNDLIDIIRAQIKDMNDKKIIDYSYYEIYIYTTKENIEILNQNRDKYFETEHQNQIDNLYEIINEKNNKIYELEEEISEKEWQIENLEEELNDYKREY